MKEENSTMKSYKKFRYHNVACGKSFDKKTDKLNGKNSSALIINYKE